METQAKIWSKTQGFGKSILLRSRKMAKKKPEIGKRRTDYCKQNAVATSPQVGNDDAYI